MQMKNDKPIKRIKTVYNTTPSTKTNGSSCSSAMIQMTQALHVRFYSLKMRHFILKLPLGNINILHRVQKQIFHFKDRPQK